MKRLSMLIMVLFTLIDYGHGRAHNEQGFYAYQGTGRVIKKLQNLLVADAPNFTYGFQSYGQKKILNTACFYNQPSNMLHYVLTTVDNHTLHFQIPLLELDKLTQINTEEQDKQSIQLVFNDQFGMKVKEHNANGEVIFSLKFTSYVLPISNATDVQKVSSLFEKIINKADKFQQQ